MTPPIRSNRPRVCGRARHYVGSRLSFAREVWGEILRDDCLDLAAQMSFYFVLALFPFLLVLAAIVGWLPSTNLWQTFAEWAVNYLPQQTQRMFFSTILGLTRGNTSIFSLGLAGTVWSASSGFVSLMESLSVAYGAPDTRSFWRKRMIAIAATFLAALFFIASFGLLTLGHWVAAAVTHPLEAFANIELHWKAARWFGTFLLMCFGLDLIDYFLPCQRRRWHWMPPSNVFVALTFVLATWGFNFYVRHSTGFSKVYGTLEGFIVFMVWVYIANLLLLAGAEADKVAERPAGPGASS